jgi:hypothetical protein
MHAHRSSVVFLCHRNFCDDLIVADRATDLPDV